MRARSPSCRTDSTYHLAEWGSLVKSFLSQAWGPPGTRSPQHRCSSHKAWNQAGPARTTHTPFLKETPGNPPRLNMGVRKQEGSPIPRQRLSQSLGHLGPELCLAPAPSLFPLSLSSECGQKKLPEHPRCLRLVFQENWTKGEKSCLWGSQARRPRAPEHNSIPRQTHRPQHTSGVKKSYTDLSVFRNNIVTARTIVHTCML